MLTDLDSSKDLITVTLGRLVTPKVAQASEVVDELCDVTTLGARYLSAAALARVQYQHLIQFTPQDLSKSYPTSLREALQFRSNGRFSPLRFPLAIYPTTPKRAATFRTLKIYISSSQGASDVC